jgi:hypothetical protein
VLANDGSLRRWHVLHRLTSFWKTCDGPAFLPERNAHTSWRQTLVRHPIIVVGAQHPDIVRACHMRAAPDMATGIALADRLAREAFSLAPDAPLEFLDVPHALLTMPRLTIL